MLRQNTLITVAAATLLSTAAIATAKTSNVIVGDDFIAQQRSNLADETKGLGFGPQSPRDIDSVEGTNPVVFGFAPEYTMMNLCNIHFHESAEHKGGNFTTYAGNGDGHGYGTGFVYDGELTEAELTPFEGKVGKEKHGNTVQVGETIEFHFVHSTAVVKPGETLGACLDDETGNPQLRVEAVVYVLVNDDSAIDFNEVAKIGQSKGFYQAAGIPSDAGTPVLYTGSTTGPSYNEAGSPFQVTWSVRPEVQKLSIKSLAKWLESNEFNEDHAHGVRNLVVNPELLSEIK